MAQNQYENQRNSLLAEGDAFLEDLDRKIKVSCSELIPKAYDTYKTAGLTPEEAWSRVVEKSEWAKTTLEKYKPKELKNAFRIHGRNIANAKKLVAISTETGNVIYEPDGEPMTSTPPYLSDKDQEVKPLMPSTKDFVGMGNQVEMLQDQLTDANATIGALRSQIEVLQKVNNNAGDKDLTQKLEAAEMEIQFLKGEDVDSDKLFMLKEKFSDAPGQCYRGRAGIVAVRKKLDELEKKGIQVVSIFMKAI